MENELDEEFRLHMENRARDLERSGVARGEAERRARIEFGGDQKFREECREAVRIDVFETMLQDLCFGLRMLRKSPGFTAVAVLTLALGIGATAAIFSVVYAALLRPLPYRQPDRLVTLGETRTREKISDPTDSQFWNVSYPDYLDWAQQSKVFESLAGFTGDGFVLHGMGEARVVFGSQATTNFFSTLGVRPILGRDFAAGEDVASGPKVAILTYRMWQGQFGGDPNVIGRSIQLDANSVNIIGVLPREFEFAPRGNAEIWVPLHLNPNMAARRNLRWIRAVGRLKSGTTPEQARSEMNTINARLVAAYPQENSAIHLVMVGLSDRIVGKVKPLLLVLFGAVGFVLLIACANVANLLLARASSRRKEFTVRVALGASRARLISQLLSESLILASAGGAFGLVASRWTTSLLIGGIPSVQLASMPFLRHTQVNGVVLAFLFSVVLSTALAFGLAPAMQASHEVVGDALREETRTSAGGMRKRLRGIFVVVEIAFCLVLLTGAGLMVKSLATLLQRDPGFDTHNLLAFSVNLPTNAYSQKTDVLRFDRTFTDRVTALPGMRGIGSISVPPLTGGGNTIRFLIEGQPMPVGEENECNIRDVSATYFSVMRIALLGGRFFNDSEDSVTSPRHILVNQSWVERYLGGENPMDRRVVFTYSPTETYREIVGVVATNADRGLDSLSEPAIFVPFQQAAGNFITYIVRTSENPAGAVGAVHSALRDVNSELPLIQPTTMEEMIAQSPSVFLRRYPSYLLGSFAVLALALATIGLYGVISYTVSQRTREIGIRVALGAQRSHVMGLILGEGLRLALIGIAVGLAASLALTQLMRSLLFGVSPYDPSTFLGVAILSLAVSMVASYFPAYRAVRADPIAALRYE
jgi:predicted permease